ncbi:MAG TPA: HAMP domain-containing protein [Nocardioides sp.]|nr:HAMP domain-containing protein [Nocardioides sp.]
MRERLVVALVGLTVAVIALYGVPRAYVLADLVERQELRKLERSADIATHLVDVAETNGVAVTPALLEGVLHEAERVVVEPGDGIAPVRAGRATPGPDDLRVTRPLEGGGTLRFYRSADLVEERVSAAILPLVLIGLGLVLAAVAAGILLARWLSRPFQELAAAAERLGSGRFDLELPPQGVREADQVATALTESGRRLEQLLTHERELAVHASHELRTPVAALRLELEDLASWPQTDPEVALQLGRAVGQLDRLADSVTRLLDQAREGRRESETEVEVVGVVRDEVTRRAPGIEVGGAPLRARLDGHTLRALVAAITDSAADGEPGASRLVVSGGGERLRLALAPRTSAGPELERVRDLAAAMDGLVILEPDPADGFAVLLPLRPGRPDPSSSGAP